MNPYRGISLVLVLGLLCGVASVEVQAQTPTGFAYIWNVPDWNQPTLAGAFNTCAPISAANILDYYDPFPYGGTFDPGDTLWYNSGIPDSSNTADYIAWFMGTNGAGSPSRINGFTDFTGDSIPDSIPGTFFTDQDTGLAEYLLWDSTSTFPRPPGPFPAWKAKITGSGRVVGSTPGLIAGWDTLTTHIEGGRPVKVDFTYWNPEDQFIPFEDSVSQDSFFLHLWGNSTTCSDTLDGDPPEEWTDDIGHAVTAVGYIPNWDGDGLTPPQNWVIVHDNWPNTAVNVVIPWNHLMGMVTVDLRLQFEYPIDRQIPIPPHSNTCALSGFEGLDPPGWMGIDAEPYPFYFPTDTAIGYPPFERASLESGVHLATAYASSTSEIGHNPVIVVPDRYGEPCGLYLEIPDEEYIDEATDLNVIRIDSGDVEVLPVEDTVETLVFVACCGGTAEYPGGPSPDQTLEVGLEYDDATIDVEVFPDIHPAGRMELMNPEGVFLFGNEVFACAPAYYDQPSPGYDPYHSGTWHWYVLYPDDTKELEGISFHGVQGADESGIYILAVSYRGRGGEELCGDANGDGSVTTGDGYQIMNHIGDPEQFPLSSWWAANVNGAGDITPGDGYHLLNHFGDPVGFPLDCQPCGMGLGSEPAPGDRAWLATDPDGESMLTDLDVDPGDLLSFDLFMSTSEIGHAVLYPIVFDPLLLDVVDVRIDSTTFSRSETWHVFERIEENRATLFVWTAEYHGGIRPGTHRIGSASFLTRASVWDESDLPCISPDPGNTLYTNGSTARDHLLSATGVTLRVAGGLECESLGRPLRYELQANRPNPFHGKCTIHFALPEDAHAVLEIYDATGRRIRVLRDSPMPHGWHEVSFEGRDDDGRQVPSGIYFCRLSTSGFEITRRMVLMR
jgi:hypothetical protein